MRGSTILLFLLIFHRIQSTILPNKSQQTVNRIGNTLNIKYAMRTELLQIVMLLLLFCRKYQKSTAFIPVDDYYL